MASIFFRTLIIYFLLSISMRVMGKRQIGELDVSDLVSTLLISEIAAIPIDDSDIPLMNAVIPISFIVCLEIIISALKNKSSKVKKYVEGRPEFIIFKGKLLQKALLENRISINELLSEMRIFGCADIKDIDYCILEQNGKLSFINVKNPTGEVAHPIIIDGVRNDDEIKLMKLSEKDISALLGGTMQESIFLFTLDDSNKTNIIIKEEI